jgi:hypothetical protein
MRNVVKVHGSIRAIADQTHPLQTKLSLILTDFNPNGNRQGIPLTEKENIIRTAPLEPIKINFTGDGYSGHAGAFPIGAISSAYAGQDNGRDVIFADAVLWNDIYEDIDDHLKAAFAEGVGTSWEIYYTDSEMDADGVQWLSDCIFAGTCIVDVPAYGPNRTRILAIAEKLNEVHMSVKDTPEIIKEEKQEVAEDLSETRTDLNEASDLLFKLWEGLDTLYTRTFEIEQATVETDLGKIAASFAERIAKIADHIASLTEKHGIVTAERDTLQQEKETAERNTLIVKRTSRLAEVGIDIADEETEKLQRYLSMSEDVFSALIADFSTARKPAVAEKKDIVIPEPLGTTREFKSMKELAAALKKL